MTRLKFIFTILILLISILIISPQFEVNLGNLTFLSHLNDDGRPLRTTGVSNGCRQIWLRIAVLSNIIKIPIKEDDQITMVDCGEKYVSLLKNLTPLNPQLAAYAVIQYPSNADTWFWLGESIAEIDPVLSLKAFMHYTSLDSQDGMGWCHLGNAFEGFGEITHAMNAYINCCEHLDPGWNGCYGAGRMAEKLGDPIKAIEYYRLSNWDGALNRADELESQMQP